MELLLEDVQGQRYAQDFVDLLDWSVSAGSSSDGDAEYEQFEPGTGSNYYRAPQRYLLYEDPTDLAMDSQGTFAIGVASQSLESFASALTSSYSAIMQDQLRRELTPLFTTIHATLVEATTYIRERIREDLRGMSKVHLQALLSTGRVEEAFKVARIWSNEYPDDADLARFRELLAPGSAEVTDREPNAGALANREWLAENRLEFRGQWVALRNGSLVGHNSDLDSLLDVVGREEGIVFTKVF